MVYTWLRLKWPLGLNASLARGIAAFCNVTSGPGFECVFVVQSRLVGATSANLTLSITLPTKVNGENVPIYTVAYTIIKVASRKSFDTVCMSLAEYSSINKLVIKSRKHSTINLQSYRKHKL